MLIRLICKGKVVRTVGLVHVIPRFLLETYHNVLVPSVKKATRLLPFIVRVIEARELGPEAIVAEERTVGVDQVGNTASYVRNSGWPVTLFIATT